MQIRSPAKVKHIVPKNQSVTNKGSIRIAKKRKNDKRSEKMECSRALFDKAIDSKNLPKVVDSYHY